MRRIQLLVLAIAGMMAASASAPAQVDYFHRQVYEVGEVDHAIVCDLNDDGAHDLVLSGDDSFDGINVLLGDGNGIFAPSTSLRGWSRYLPVAVADFDRDGILDIFAAEHGLLVVQPGAGDGTFLPAVETQISEDHLNAVAAADFNNDGRMDVALTRWTNRGDILVYPGTGIGTFGSPIETPTDGYSHGIQTGDFNEDGNADVVCGYGELGGAVFIGDGTGAFTSIRGLSNAESFLIGDFDGDAHSDVARINGTLVIDYGDGTGEFERVSVPGTIARSWALAAADFDLDGRTDFAYADGDTPAVRCARGLSHRTFLHLPLARQTGGFKPRAMVCADFDGDGETDVAVGHKGIGDGDVLSVHLNGTKHHYGCALGRVNMAQHFLVDTLFINGSSGTDAQRRLVLGRDDPLSISMDAAPGTMGDEGYFALYAYADLPTWSTTRAVPFAMGVSCLPVPIAPAFSILPVAYWNNTTLMSDGGHRLDVPGKAARPSMPAPSLVARLPQGVGRPMRAFFQGIIHDPHSNGGVPASVTNGVEVVIN